MSHYLHHVIEVNKNGKWETFKVLSYPGSYIKEEHPDYIIKVGDTEMYYNSEFVTSYLSLRDNYFSHNPWKKSDSFNYGVPENADEKTKEITKYYVDGGFTMYNCTVSELEREAEAVYKELKELEKKENIMSYTVELGRRLGFGGKEEPDCEYANMAAENIEELSIIYSQFISLISQVQSLVDTITDDYWVNPESIRIIIWTD
ncbi:MAG: hypothetical protein [Wendovervirus sonii]|uniref:Uncharacterized protein n=1 Tax=phage Lak_Megaphage_Sonny TaxID=3109229 RepID=A0ABZ0Z3N0_9CAUD|nr:MAG: hypothetical protein [phage Lak_Megaphage_Sonny]